MSPETIKHQDLLVECESVINEIFARCAENAPNFGVSNECFKTSLKRTAQKYLSTVASETSTNKEKEFELILAEMIIKRELQKVVIKEYYKQK